MHDYEKQADDFLSKHGLKFEAVLIGSDCPRFCDDADKGLKMDDVNKFPRKSHIHGKHYRCTITRTSPSDQQKARGGMGCFVSDFWNSYSDEEFNALGSKEYREGGSGVFKYGRVKVILTRPGQFTWKNGAQKTVRAYDLLACLTKYDPGTFRDFCSEFGYDDDSMKAFSTYQAVQEEFGKTQRFFTAEEMKELQEIN